MARKPAALQDPQLPLLPAYSTVYETHAAAIRALLTSALRENAVSQEQLAHITGKDPSHLSRMLIGKGAHPSLDVIAAVMALDAKGVFVCGLAAMCGREAIERKPDPAAELKALRSKVHALRDELDSLLEGAS